MRKIIIIGSGGAGKSTLSKKLGKKLGLPVFHLDAFFWNPGWEQTPKDTFIEMADEMINNPEWIIDGNYGSTLEPRMEAADTIILLNYSRYICVGRALKRRIMYHNKTRPDMAEGCEEKIDLEFLKWIWKFPKEKTPLIFEKLERFSSDKNIIIHSSPKQTEKWLSSLTTKENNI
ncbi:DNA topology modulation protein [Jeotgalibacillus proteolyticus]|uniref:Topology modulation protein n=1 Tax=Jeotgalibacillus proteolyticus TaxID=2082395 RepID=A0A2S5GCH8_9BACL|nr:DNA topology modulation protein [Jeotgalibacillus proteolyticus]PPA70625.1 hypothetical protein C4B60_07440 [Jeotgalibacillus proteolyticus]